MLGRKELDKLSLEKQALLLESGLNRLALQAEMQNLRSSTAWLSEVTRVSKEAKPLLLVLAPIAGFLLARGSRRSDSWCSRVAAAAKWIGPVYQLWRSFSSSRKAAEPGEPTA